MDDQEPLTPEEQLLADAKAAAAAPPESVPDTTDLPDDVKDGDSEDQP